MHGERYSKTVIQISLPVNPTTWSAAIVTKYGAYDKKSSYKKGIRWLIKSLYRGRPIKGFVVLDLLFIFSVPKSVSAKEKALMLKGEIIPTSKDTTNLQKLYEDCSKKILFEDDRYVAKNISEKLYGDNEKVIIKVFSLQEYRELNENNLRRD